MRGTVAITIALATAVVGGLSAPAEAVDDARRPRAMITVTGTEFGKPMSVRVAVTGGRASSIQLWITGAAVSYNLVGPPGTSWSLPWPGVGRRTLKAKVVLQSGRRVYALTRAQVSPTRSGGFQLMYVYPAGHYLAGQERAIANAAHLTRFWYSSQMGGPAPMFVNDPQGMPSVVKVEVPQTAEELASVNIVASSVDAWKASGLIPADSVPFAFVGGLQPVDGCGISFMTPQQYVVVPMAACGITASMQDRFPYGATYIIAHEVAHQLGAMSDNAPHNDGGDHVADNPADLLYFGRGPRDWEHLALDPGHDDYYLTGRTDLVNIENSPLLDTG